MRKQSLLLMAFCAVILWLTYPYGRSCRLNASAGGAASPDSRHWTVQPTPILKAGAPGHFDARLEEADGYIAGSTYYVNYCAWNGPKGPVGSIGQASGSSLTSLTRRGQILKPTPGAWDSGYVSGPRTYYESGTYYLYYFGSPTAAFEAAPSSLGVATSSSPAGPFKKYSGNPILKAGPAGTWDGKQLFRPLLLKNGSTYYLFYNGNGSLGGEQIGFATGPSPLGPFTKHARNPVYYPKLAREASRVGDPVIYKDGSHWVMYYYGASDSLQSQGVGCATSPDLASWTECAGDPIPMEKLGSTGLIRPSLLPENNYGTMLVDNTGTNLYAAHR